MNYITLKAALTDPAPLFDTRVMCRSCQAPFYDQNGHGLCDRCLCERINGAGELELDDPDDPINVPKRQPARRNQRYTLDRGVQITSAQLREAAHAWECGGCLMLGSWAARNKLSYQYSALVRLVREYTHDTTDYSQSAEQEAAR